MAREFYNNVLLNFIFLSLMFEIYGHNTASNDGQQKADITHTQDEEKYKSPLEQKMKKHGILFLEELVVDYGYPISKYRIETKDGYILHLFRIKNGKAGINVGPTKRKPVLLQHGLLDSSAAYLASKTGMAYTLADNGYDVWVGNSRGTIFSREHISDKKNPDAKGTTYWQFSFHEMGVYDLPAVLDEIRKHTDEKIHYIGMSMGTTQFLVMCSEEETTMYQQYIDKVILMAPVARPQHMSLLSGVAYFFSTAYFHSLLWSSKGETFTYRASVAEYMYKFCISNRNLWQKSCEKVLRKLANPKDGNDLFDFKNTLPVYQYSPAGSSVQTFIHYIQIASSGNFQKYDYGKPKNKEVYGSEKPPLYTLEKIEKHVILITGGADEIAHVKDVEWLTKNLKSCEVIKDRFDYFTHRDFHFSRNIDQTLYSVILEKLGDKDQVPST